MESEVPGDYRYFSSPGIAGRLALGFAVLMSFLVFRQPVEAQEEDAAVLTEIVVTAQRREQSLQDVPVSTAAFSGDAISRLNLVQPLDVVAQVPNASVFSIFGEAQQPSIGIRGVTLTNFNDSFESPVAFYVDEVYKGTAVGQSTQLFDIERIEILKGPQGTLYGRNTTGGLIHAITRKPSDQLEISLSAEIGSFDTRRLEAAVGGRLGQRARGRIAGLVDRHDGWSDGFVDGVDYNDGDTVAVRGTVEFDLSDRGQLSLSGHYSDLDQNSVGYGLRGYLDPDTGERCSMARINSGECVSPLLGNRSANDLGGLNPRNTPGSNLPADRGAPPRQQVEIQGFSARLNWDYGGWQLDALLAADDVSKLYEEDLDADGFFFDDGFDMESEEWKAEIRASGDYNEVDWLVGLFYFDDEKDIGSFLIPVDLFSTSATQATDSWALFAHVEIPLADRLRLTVGGRYTEEDKDLLFSRRGFLEDIGETRAVASEVFTGVISLAWDISDATMAYGSLSTGFKSGGFNTQLVFGPIEEIDPVANEEITAYELGVKSDFWSGRARVNAAAFYYDYRDLQINVFTQVPGAPFPSNFLRNAGDAEIYGLEADLEFAVAESTRINLGVGLLDTELLSDAVTDSFGELIALQGNRLSGSPETQLIARAYHGIQLNEYGSLELNAAYSWQDDVFFTVENKATGAQESYGLLNLGATWRAADSPLSVEAFVENALDEEYYIFSTDLDPSFGLVAWGKPRWWGLRVNYQY